MIYEFVIYEYINKLKTSLLSNCCGVSGIENDGAKLLGNNPGWRVVCVCVHVMQLDVHNKVVNFVK